MDVSLSSFFISIYRIFLGTLLKFHGTSNTPITNVILHRPHIVSNEWGQCLNFFKPCMYVSKFDMVRLDTCLDGMGGFQDSRISDVLATKYLKTSRFATMFIMGISLSSFVVSICRIFVGTLLKFHGNSNSPTINVMHQPLIVSSEWGQL
jgi:hypothetical protein